MTLTVTHAKNVAIADDPKAAAAGEILPSDWNANHIVTGVALEMAGGNKTFQVNGSTGSDATGDGSVSKPYATIQHAVTVALGFDYEGLYFARINVADGTYNESVTLNAAFNTGGTEPISGAIGVCALVGNPTMPANCKIAPNGLNNINIITIQRGAKWTVDGFTIKGDPSYNQANPMIQVQDFSDIRQGNLIFDTTGNTSGSNFYDSCIEIQRWSFLGGTNDDAGTVFNCPTGSLNIYIDIRRYSLAVGFSSFNFAVANNMAGGHVFELDAFAEVTSLPTFVNPGNVTNALPVFMITYSTFDTGGVDPTTITWPGGAFSTSFIDETSSIFNDSNSTSYFYAVQKSGVPANTDLFKGSWGVFKDTTGGGVYVAYNDAGIIKKVALT